MGFELGWHEGEGVESSEIVSENEREQMKSLLENIVDTFITLTSGGHI